MIEPITPRSLPALWSLVFALLLTPLLAAPATAAGILRGQVILLDDGDSLVVRDRSGRQHKVRLGGIDAPERYQPYNRQARNHLAHLVLHQQVTVDWTSKTATAGWSAG